MKPNARRFQRQRGAAAVEFAIVVPLLLTLVVGIMDVSNLLYVYNSMLTAAREASRSVAVAQQTVPQATATAQTKLAVLIGKNGPIPFTINITVPVLPANLEVKTTISASMSQALMLDMFKLLGGATIVATSSMRKET